MSWRWGWASTASLELTARKFGGLSWDWWVGGWVDKLQCACVAGELPGRALRQAWSLYPKACGQRQVAPLCSRLRWLYSAPLPYPHPHPHTQAFV